jgi:MOSC domain-containing protein YiiM
MRVLSTNVGLPREIQWRGRTIETGIVKEPVSGRVIVDALNLRGDRQADLTARRREQGGVPTARALRDAKHDLPELLRIVRRTSP